LTTIKSSYVYFIVTLVIISTIKNSYVYLIVALVIISKYYTNKIVFFFGGKVTSSLVNFTIRLVETI